MKFHDKKEIQQDILNKILILSIIFDVQNIKIELSDKCL